MAQMIRLANIRRNHCNHLILVVEETFISAIDSWNLALYRKKNGESQTLSLMTTAMTVLAAVSEFPIL